MTAEEAVQTEAATAAERPSGPREAIGTRVPAITVPAEEILDGPTGTLFTLLRERRGWTDDYIQRIESVDHPVLVGMDGVLEQLKAIHDQRVPITVMPDFDMDGITSGVIGLAGLAELGFDVELYTPDFRDGHDILPSAVDKLFAAHPRTGAVITCDAGINSTAGIARIKELGAIAIVTDHHVELDGGSRPIADAVVDPGRQDESYEDRDGLTTTICGAHVLWQVLDEYARAHRPDKVHSIRLLRLFAGIGTVSDVMPLTFENRQAVRDSLSLTSLFWVPIEEGDTVSEYDPENGWMLTMLRAGQHAPEFVSVFEGYAYALKAFREAGKLRSDDDIDEGFYGFYLAPAFNAIRRIEGDMADAFGSFVAPTSDEKLASVNRIIEGNERRKELTKVLVEGLRNASDAEQPHRPFVYVTDAPSGMLGLLAQQLMHDSGLPCIVVSRRDDPDAPTGGSARSPFWFPVISTLTPGGFTAIGHENACGVRVASSREIPALAAFVEERAREIYAELHADGSLADADRADMVFGVGDTDADLDDLEALLAMVVQMERLAPFGQGHERPVFDLALDLSKCHISAIGTADEEGVKPHLRIVSPHGLKLSWWNQSSIIPELEEIADDPRPGASRVVFRCDLQLNVWMDVKSVHASIERMHPRED